MNLPALPDGIPAPQLTRTGAGNTARTHMAATFGSSSLSTVTFRTTDGGVDSNYDAMDRPDWWKLDLDVAEALIAWGAAAHRDHPYRSIPAGGEQIRRFRTHEGHPPERTPQ